jgi:peptidoglycan/xylan/chitin deacetylase (PgdA/CDA1 family)
MPGTTLPAKLGSFANLATRTQRYALLMIVGKSSQRCLLALLVALTVGCRSTAIETTDGPEVFSDATAQDDATELDATSPAVPALPTQARMVFVCDDSSTQHWNVLRPIFRQAQKHVVWAIITGQVASNSALTQQQVATLYAEGDEIASHTVSHPKLSIASQQAQRHELEQSADFIRVLTGVAPPVMVFPFGAAPNPIELLDERYRFGVTTAGDPPLLPVAMPNRIARVAFAEYLDGTRTIDGVKYYNPNDANQPSDAPLTNSLAYYQAHALRAKRENRLLVFMVHTGGSQAQVALLAPLMHYADSIGLPVGTLTRGL